MFVYQEEEISISLWYGREAAAPLLVRCCSCKVTSVFFFSKALLLYTIILVQLC